MNALTPESEQREYIAKAKRSLDELLKAREQPVVPLPQYARD